MPFFDIKSENGDVFKVEHPQAPTTEEAQAFLDSQYGGEAALPQPVPAGLQNVQTQEQFEAAYDQEKGASTLSKAFNIPVTQAKNLYGMIEPIVTGIPKFAAEQFDRAVSQPPPKTLSESISRTVEEGFTGPKSVAEGARRFVGGVAPSIASDIQQNAAPIEGAFRDYKAGKIGIGDLLTTAFLNQNLAPGANIRLSDIFPTTPSQGEKDAAYQAYLKSVGREEGVKAPSPVLSMLPGRVSEPLAEGTRSAIPASLIAITPGLRGAIQETVAKVSNPIKGGIEKMTGRTSPLVKFEDASTKATGLAPIDGGTEISTIAKNTIEEFVGKQPPNLTALQARDAAIKTQNLVIEKANSGFALGEEQGLVVKGNQLIRDGIENIKRENPELATDLPENAQRINGIMKSFNHLEKEVSPTQAQKDLARLNVKYNAMVDKSGPEASAYRAVRNSLSNQLDDIYKAATGMNESPYRVWGKLQQFIMGDGGGGLEGQIRSAQTSQVSGNKKASPSIPVAPYDLKHKIAKSIVPSQFIPRNIETVDKAVQTVFKNAPKSEPILPIEDAVRQALRLKQQAGGNPPPLPAFTVPPPKIGFKTAQTQASDLEQAIAQKIRTYPPKIRNDPNLARLAAMKELGYID